MSILDLHTEATIAAAPRMVNVPRAAPAPKFSTWSLLTAIPRGVAEAGAQVSASALELLEPFGATLGRMDGETPEPGFGRAMAEDVRTGASAALAPDAQTAHAAEQTLYGFARGASKVVLGSAAGPAGVLVAGAEEGLTATRELQRQGVDDTTALKAGAVQGAGLALAALPLAGKTLQQTLALYLAGGPGGFVAQQALTREILRQGGYDQIAEGYDPFDPVGLAVSTLVPAVFTAAALRSQRRVPTVSREAEDAARVLLQVEQRDASNPAPDVPRAADAHEAALVKAEEQMARGDAVEVADVAPVREYGSALTETRLGDIIDTRGAGGRFHGTSRAIDSLSDEYAMSGDSRNIYGQGFYTTDAVDIAEGYSRKGRGGDPTLYAVAEKDVPLFDMDRPLTDQMRAMLRSVVGDADYEGSFSLIDGARTLRAWFDEFRAESRNFGLSRDDVQEIWDSVRTNLEEQGFRGYKHTGGDKTGKAPHEVRIYWFPEQDTAITRDNFANYRMRQFAVSADALRRALARPVDDVGAARPSNVEDAGPAPADAQAPAMPDAGAEGAATPGASAEQGAATARLAQIRAQFPDLQVQLDGMDAPMALDDFLAAVKAEADELAADGPLMQVAAECSLLNGAG